MCMHARSPEECVEGRVEYSVYYWRLMWWIHGCDNSSQPAACTAMTPAGCIDRKGRGQITYTPGKKTGANTTTVMVSSLFWVFIYAVIHVHLFLHLCLILLLSPTGHGPQTGLITPSFGMKGNSSASVPRGPVPTRPVPQPHPKDEDTLVQMAEHIPAGTRTPMCAHCNMVIR